MPSLLRRGRAVAATVFFAVLVARGAYLVSLSRTPLSLWHLWAETDEWGYVDWSAHLAAGNWRDVPAWRSLDWADAWAPVWDLAQRAGVEAVVVYPRIARQVPDRPSGMAHVAVRELRIET